TAMTPVRKSASFMPSHRAKPRYRDAATWIEGDRSATMAEPVVSSSVADSKCLASVCAAVVTLVAAPRGAAAQDEPYAAAGVLVELLCDGGVEGRSCGTDLRGVPMVCGRADACHHPAPCLACYRVAQPDAHAPSPEAPHRARLAETVPQMIERERTERHIAWT